RPGRRRALALRRGYRPRHDELGALLRRHDGRDAQGHELPDPAAHEAGPCRGEGHAPVLPLPRRRARPREGAARPALGQDGARWRKVLKKGDLVLVADVGGGTTDFTLISVSEEGGNLTLERTAVGEHLLLGGDNMDVALAHLLAERLKGQGHDLDAWQSRGLW